ncbi:glycosyl transferase group 1 [Chthoniobacter flavus Ellin428]|uniref:Glycosyl transferase group 1 n=1 Tax=Chthoniobacter flavus Ellin428 TaxID=497964 RepID=B4DAH2_9BACT|nr:glycosyltransferase family 4 protein [Chthoniobacter flavus]EDY16633.1 glycosyl transferase group 1 [Chthoniobacter flavus Ellin428]TCO91948.1 glycosyltransferase involved in cell wall biosynthesis [Chthoniobacter flavus]
MRILVLCYEYPPLGGGGGRVAQSIARQMEARGHDVRVQTAALGWRPDRDEDHDVKVFRTPSGRRKADTCSVPEMGLYCLTSFLPTLFHIRDWKPDVIHAHFAVPTGVLALAAHRLTGVPYVLTAHLGDVPGGVPEQTDRMFKLIGPAARQIWQHAAEATAVSTFVQELAEKAYHRPVTRILNGIDLNHRPEQPSAVRPTRHLVFVGRFNPQKNLPFLIGALARLPKDDWRATIVGDGPERAVVEALVEKHRLRERIALPGWQSTSQVSDILEDADILCMPSTSEGMPVAAIEALRAGLAIVASDIPGVRDVVEHEVNGYRLPLDDTYAQKLGGLLESDETLQKMKQASWEKAREFDITAIADQYENVLRKAAAIPDR